MSTITIRKNIGTRYSKAEAEALAADATNPKITSRRVHRYTTFYVTADVEVEARIQQRGTCQLCGGDWAIKGKSVSKHGYKRPRWGFLVGGCYGSFGTAAEVSTERTQAAIEDSNATIATTETLKAHLEADAKTEGRWTEDYGGMPWPDRGSSHARQVWKNAKLKAARKGEHHNEPMPPLTTYEKWMEAKTTIRNHSDYVKFLTENVLTKLGQDFREELIEGEST